MKTFKYDKIIRAESLSYLQTHKDPRISLKTTPLQGSQIDKALAKKLDEEVKEFQEAQDAQELALECGDVLEVLQATCQHKHVSWQDVLDAQQHKNKERGTFCIDTYVHHVTLPKDHRLYSYFSKKPKEYPVVDPHTGNVPVWPLFLKKLMTFTWLTQATVLSYTTLFILMPTMAFLVNALLNLGLDIGDQDLWLLTLSRDLPATTQQNLLSWWHQIIQAIHASSGWLIFCLLISQWVTSVLIQQSLQSFWPSQPGKWYRLPKLLTSLFWIFWAFGLQCILIFGGWISGWIDHFAWMSLAAVWTICLHFFASWLLFSGILWFSAPIKKPKGVWRISLLMSISFFIINQVVSWFMEHSFTLSLTFGSFSFMPTLMIWLECIWIIVVLGVSGLSCTNQ